jgi:hypothetical protein
MAINQEIKERHSLIQRIFLFIGIGWTIIIVCLSIWSIKTLDEQTSEVLLSQARSFFKLIVTTRYWNALHGGVYVPVTAETQPNPYLDVPERDLKTETGELLTLINPAYMTRQVAELAAARDQVQFHITSSKPLRPDNSATQWEAAALTTFLSENDEYYDWWADEQGTKRYFRYMAPLWTERPCLRCHAKQGYAEGELRGGISVTIPVDSFLASQEGYKRFIVVIYSLIWILGLSGTIVAFGIIRNEINQREGLIAKLQQTLGEVKTLKGFIPICASCKRVRDDVGYWEQIEIYIRDRSEAEFSHGICPECMEKLYPEYVNRLDKQEP